LQAGIKTASQKAQLAIWLPSVSTCGIRLLNASCRCAVLGGFASQVQDCLSSFLTGAAARYAGAEGAAGVPEQGLCSLSAGGASDGVSACAYATQRLDALVEPGLRWSAQDNLFEWHFVVRGPLDTEFEVCHCAPKSRSCASVLCVASHCVSP